MPDANAQRGVNQEDFALAGGRISCHGAGMAEPNSPRPALGGGIFIALSLLIGVVVGIVMRQPSIGLLAGLGVGIALAGLVALVGRRR
jgi:hypothetical protein